MKRILLSGSLLAGDFFAQTYTFLSRPPSEINVAMLVAASFGLLFTLRRFTNAAFLALTEHGDTFTD